jgi:hypothetical protein
LHTEKRIKLEMMRIFPIEKRKNSSVSSIKLITDLHFYKNEISFFNTELYFYEFKTYFS